MKLKEVGLSLVDTVIGKHAADKREKKFLAMDDAEAVEEVNRHLDLAKSKLAFPEWWTEGVLNDDEKAEAKEYSRAKLQMVNILGFLGSNALLWVSEGTVSRLRSNNDEDSLKDLAKVQLLQKQEQIYLEKSTKAFSELKFVDSTRYVCLALMRVCDAIFWGDKLPAEEKTRLVYRLSVLLSSLGQTEAAEAFSMINNTGFSLMNAKAN